MTSELVAYRGPTWWGLGRLLEAGRQRGMARLLALFVAVNALAVITGSMNVSHGWNALRVPIGPIELDLTVYPPLVLSVLAAVWIGPAYGAVPAYLANLASARAGEIAWPTAAVFALAGAIETLILWGSMVTLNIAPDLRRWRDLRLFLATSLIAPVTSSLAVVIWNAALSLDFAQGQRLWRGWVIGDFLQLGLVVLPLLHFLGQPARAWVDRQFDVSPRREITYTRAAFFASGVFVAMAALVFLGIGMLQHSLAVPADARTLRGELLPPRLFEIQLYLGLLVATLILTTGTFSTALARMSEGQRSLARRESLTGCYNRLAFYEMFHREADRSRRLSQGIALVFVDVDRFKEINDRHGHEVGDRVLQQVAIRLQAAIREVDLLFRWGGEEFVLLLSHTAEPDAAVLAERVRAAIADRPFGGRDGREPIRVTVSLGSAGTLRHPIEPDALLARADSACYRAKQAGRNRVVSAPSA